MKPRVLIWILLGVATLAVIAYYTYNVMPVPDSDGGQVPVMQDSMEDGMEDEASMTQEDSMDDMPTTQESTDSPAPAGSADAEVDAVLDEFLLEASSDSQVAIEEDEGSEVESVSSVDADENLYE